MSRYIVLVLVLVIFQSCSILQPKAQNGESFEGEDLMSLQALMLTKDGKTDEAIKLYREIYKRNNNILYLKEAIKIAYIQNEFKKVDEMLPYALKNSPNDTDLKRIKVASLIQNEQYNKAEELMIELIKNEKTALNLNVLGSILFLEKKYSQALAYYESSFQLENNTQTMLKIVDILYGFLDREKEAVAYLETESRINGCSFDTCFKLIEIYGKQKNIDGLISTYKKLYKRYKTEQYAQKVIELLIYKKDTKSAISFLEETKYSSNMLMEVYVMAGDFKNALKIAKEIYEATNDYEILGKMAIFKYEMQGGNPTKDILAKIINNFEKVVKFTDSALYLNYYGYLLIDHNINIKKGIELVKKALKKEPNSPYYIDSLAWGYYKLNKCEKALKIMQQIVKEDESSEEDEIKKHYEAIKKCIHSNTKSIKNAKK